MARSYPALTNSADTRDRASVANGLLSNQSAMTMTGVIQINGVGAGASAELFNSTGQVTLSYTSGFLRFLCRDTTSGSLQIDTAPVGVGTYRFVLDYSASGGAVVYLDSTTAIGAVAATSNNLAAVSPNWVIGSSDATAGVDLAWHELAFIAGRVSTAGERTSIFAKTGDIYDNLIGDVWDFAAEETAGRGTAHYDMRDGTESMLERTNNATAAGPDFNTLGWRGAPVWTDADAFTANRAIAASVFHAAAESGSSRALGSMPASETIRIPIVLKNSSAGTVAVTGVSATSVGSINASPTSLAAGADGVVELDIAVPASGAVSTTVTIQTDTDDDFTVTITGTARADAAATVQPHADWDGTAGSGFGGTGEAVPTESGTAHGSGFTKQVVGGIVEAQDNAFYYTENATHTVAVEVDHKDVAWVEKVEFYIEGVKQDVYLPTWDARGFSAFRCTINPTNTTVTSGDGIVRVYAKIIPVNGLERLCGPVDFFINPGESLFGETITLTASGGGDQTTLEGAANATNPATTTLISITEAGTYTQTSAFTDNEVNNGFPTIIRNDSGGVVKFVVTDASQAFRIRHDWLWLQGIVFPYNPNGSATVSSCYGAGDADGWWGFSACTFEDETYGAIGTRVQNGQTPYLDSQVNAMFRPDQRFGAFNCTFDCANGCVGLDRAVACTISHSYDGFYGENDRLFTGCTVNAFEGQVRLHSANDMTIASTSYNAGTQQTTITLSASPTWTDPRSGLIADEYYLYITTGTLAGQEFDIRDTSGGNSDPSTFVVDGDASGLASGDKAVAYLIPHGDGIQWIETGDYDNTLWGYTTTTQADGSRWLQWILAQSGDSGSITNSAIHFIRIVRDDFGTTTGQLQDNIDHLVIRNCTLEHVGTVENGVVAMADVLITDSYLAGETTTDANTTMFNCHTGTDDNADAQGLLGTGPSDPVLTSGVPGSASPLVGKGYWNRLRFDLAGRAIDQTGGAIGALQFVAASSSGTNYEPRNRTRTRSRNPITVTSGGGIVDQPAPEP